MGTRHLTILHDSFAGNEEICVLYGQYDGYPTGHGNDLAKFLGSFVEITNGIADRKIKTANGGQCLAAQVIAEFKKGVGAFYLHPKGTRDCGEEYRYHVIPSVGRPIRLKVESGYGESWETIFDGNAKDFDGDKIESSDE